MENPMLNDKAFREQIHQANVEVHRIEAQYYESLHPEVYTKKEQKRIIAQLKTIDDQINDNHKNALDVGAGTGNLTGKLLKMGYTVVATDISPEMCEILKEKYAAYLPNKLTVVNSPIEELIFAKGKFDLVTFYSVLHHLPDYVTGLKTVSAYLKKGGIIYIDHEASPFYWKNEPRKVARLVKSIFFHSNPMINSLYFKLIGFRVPTIDYSLSDYWHKKNHALNHQTIAQIFKQEGFESYKRTDHFRNETWLPNPLSYVYRLLGRPEMSSWIAKK
jgi:ubiquinone/menaquinone biosynthesis C-methylase UbiE